MLFCLEIRINCYLKPNFGKIIILNNLLLLKLRQDYVPDIARFGKKKPTSAAGQVAIDSHCESRLHVPAIFFYMDL